MNDGRTSQLLLTTKRKTDLSISLPGFMKIPQFLVGITGSELHNSHHCSRCHSQNYMEVSKKIGGIITTFGCLKKS